MLKIANLDLNNTIEGVDNLPSEVQQNVKGGMTGLPGAGWIGGTIFGAVGGYVSWKLSTRYGASGGGIVPSVYAGTRLGNLFGTTIGASLSD